MEDHSGNASCPPISHTAEEKPRPALDYYCSTQHAPAQPVTNRLLLWQEYLIRPRVSVERCLF